MYVAHLFLISALLVVNASGNCEKCPSNFYDFLSDILQFFNVHSDEKDTKNVNQTVIDLSEEDGGWNFEYILRNITGFFENYNNNIEQVHELEKISNNTKIVVKTFEVNDVLKNLEVTEKDTTTEYSTTEYNAAEELSLIGLTSPDSSTTDATSVIPLNSNKNTEINDSLNVVNSETDSEEADYPNIDYIEIYKDTTNEVVEYIPTTVASTTTEFNELRAEIDKQESEIENIIEHSVHILLDEDISSIIENVTSNNFEHKDKSSLSSLVFPWIAAIFLKNDSKDGQFDYFCDGALLSDYAVITAARCISNENVTHTAEDFIVILGKTSLQNSGGNEKIYRVKEVKIHENFSLEDNEARNDLAILILEESVKFGEGISTAIFDDTEEMAEDLSLSTTAVTTAWSISGDLTLIYFDKEKSEACGTHNKVENTLCATYGNVPFCPSYGGLYVISRLDKAYLRGIRTADRLHSNFCISKELKYTSLKNYTEWISNNL